MQLRLLSGHVIGHQIDVRALDGGTAAQLVWLGLDDDGGPSLLQVNASIPAGLRAAAARHLNDAHMASATPRCVIRDCALAQEWLGEVQPVSARRATRSA